ncbi:Bug family tripartite tricarboxylate transporter substrate binding protein [Plastoroseomonas hellenica]|uniref:Bug family tripartite tricarboxylate transporter substrate binding protein n=1 Tax=Plastoroseomonas hellenica TaxID=2687306 RepID=UPI001BA5CBBC|nr:tripartite tricarboxylate transporter substrate binding protein [Plastoroseomonas hellenica]MBR0645016.1 tripartite tricarboxylate transporter substrate binding protein [Plastoroseomonas hellenica]
MQRRTALMLIPALSAALARPSAAQSAPFPDRPLRMVIPFAAGGSNDIVGRVIAEGMGARLGQTIVVENRGGAGGILGNEVVARAPKDGHTFLLGGSGSFLISSLVQPRIPYDIIRDFTPIGFLGAAPNVITVNPGVAATTMGELRDLARGSRVPLSYASPGAGTTGHLLGALLSLVFGAEMEHVPYRGTGPAITDVLAGRVQILTNAAAPLRPHIASGGLRAIAVAAPRRLAILPEVSSAVEQGFPDVVSSTWYGLLTPSGVPAERIGALHAALNATLADAAVQQRLAEEGVEVEPSTAPQDFGSFIERDRQRWQQVVTRTNIRAE